MEEKTGIEFTIWGKTLSVSNDREVVTGYRKLFMKMAFDIIDDVELPCKIEKLRKEGYSAGIETISLAIDVAIDILVENNIYDITIESFYSNYYIHHSRFKEAFECVHKAYNTLLNSSNPSFMIKAWNESVPKKRKAGGLGITEDACNAFNALIENGSSGFTVDILNYFDTTTHIVKLYDLLYLSIWADIAFMYIPLCEALKENGFKNDLEYIDSEKATKLLLNLNRIDNIEKKKEVLFQCLECDPYIPDIYSQIFLNDALADPSLADISRFFLYRPQKIKDAWILENLPDDTSDEISIQTWIAKQKKKYVEYGFTDPQELFSSYLILESILGNEYKRANKNKNELRSHQEKLIKKIKKYRKEREDFAEDLLEKVTKDMCTYNGTVFNTVEERDKAELADAELLKRTEHIEEFDDEQIDEVLKDINEVSHSKKIKDKILKKIIKLRTYDDVEFESLIDMNEAIQELNDLMSLKNFDLSTKHGCDLLSSYLEKFDRSIKTPKEKLIKKYTKNIKETLDYAKEVHTLLDNTDKFNEKKLKNLKNKLIDYPEIIRQFAIKEIDKNIKDIHDAEEVKKQELEKEIERCSFEKEITFENLQQWKKKMQDKYSKKIYELCSKKIDKLTEMKKEEKIKTDSINSINSFLQKVQNQELVFSLDFYEIREDYKKFEEKRGLDSEYDSVLESVYKAIKNAICKKVKTALVGFEEVSLSRLKEIKYELLDCFTYEEFMHLIEDDKKALEAEILKREKDIENEEVEKEYSNMSSLSKSSLVAEISRWKIYKPIDKKKIEDLLEALNEKYKKVIRKEAEDKCSNLSKLSVDETRCLINDVKNNYCEVYIDDLINNLEKILSDKIDEEIKKWLPESPAGMNEIELCEIISKFNSYNYDHMYFDKYLSPFLVRKNELFLEKAMKMISFMQNMAAPSLSRFLSYKSRDDITSQLVNKFDADTDLDIEVCYFSFGGHISTKKIRLLEKNIFWNNVKEFSIGKRFLKNVLVWIDKYGVSTEFDVSPNFTKDILQDFCTLLNNTLAHLNYVNEMLLEESENKSLKYENREDNVIIQEASIVVPVQVIDSINIRRSRTVQDRLHRPLLPSVPVHTTDEMKNFVSKMNLAGNMFTVKSPDFSKKVGNAIKAYASGINPSDVFLLYDFTVLGSAKEGFLMTREGVYAKQIMMKQIFVTYQQIDGFRMIYDKNKKTHMDYWQLSREYYASILSNASEDGVNYVMNRINTIVAYLFGLEEAPYEVLVSFK